MVEATTPIEPKIRESSLLHGAWRFTAASGSISGREQLQQIQERLPAAQTLPEMLFGSNFLSITHVESGTEVRFDAVSALNAWIISPAPHIQVKNAKHWSACNATEIERSNAKILDYDWTFTTDYGGDVCKDSEHVPDNEFQPMSTTFSRALLLERAPILFSAEVPLFESEMDDNGVSACTVRVRVMPKCWLVLLRFWLRVDDTVLRIRETRYYCDDSDDGLVWRETKHVQGTFEELAKGGAPSSNAAFTDADSASNAMEAVAPVGVVLHKTETLKVQGS